MVEVLLEELTVEHLAERRHPFPLKGAWQSTDLQEEEEEEMAFL